VSQLIDSTDLGEYDVRIRRMSLVMSILGREANAAEEAK
jgi:hypothetical protein